MCPSLTAHPPSLLLLSVPVPPQSLRPSNEAPAAGGGEPRPTVGRLALGALYITLPQLAYHAIYPTIDACQSQLILSNECLRSHATCSAVSACKVPLLCTQFWRASGSAKGNFDGRPSAGT